MWKKRRNRKEKVVTKTETVMVLHEFSSDNQSVCELYKPDYARQVFYLCLLGMTDVQIAQFFGVHNATVELWKRTRPEFMREIVRGKDEADAEIAHSLFQAAKGYIAKDTIVLTNRKKEYHENGKVAREWTEPLIVETKKHYPPNVTAAIKWLSSRHPGIWGDKITIEQKMAGNVVNTDDLSIEELEMINSIVKNKNA